MKRKKAALVPRRVKIPPKKAKKKAVKKKAVEKRPIKKRVKKRAVKKAAVKKAAVKKRGVKKRPIKKRAVKKPAVKKRPIKKPAVKKRPIKKRAAKKRRKKRPPKQVRRARQPNIIPKDWVLRKPDLARVAAQLAQRVAEKIFGNGYTLESVEGQILLALAAAEQRGELNQEFYDQSGEYEGYDTPQEVYKLWIYS